MTFAFRHKSDVLKWNNTIVIQLRILSWNHAKSWHKRHLSSCGFPVTRFFRDYKFQNPFKFFQKFYLPLRNKLCAIIVTQKIEFRINLHMILSWANLYNFTSQSSEMKKKSSQPNPTWNSTNPPKKKQPPGQSSTHPLAARLSWPNSPKLTWNCSKTSPIFPF